jgi:hypothetical protein
MGCDNRYLADTFWDLPEVRYISCYRYLFDIWGPLEDIATDIGRISGRYLEDL